MTHNKISEEIQTQQPLSISNELLTRIEEARAEYQRGEYAVLDEDFFRNL